MKNFLMSLPGLIILFSVISCSAGSNLSEGEAKKIITQSFPYSGYVFPHGNPEATWVWCKKEDLQNLLNSGHLRFHKDGIYIPTEKGTIYTEDSKNYPIIEYSYPSNFIYKGPLVKRFIKDINEILIDKQTNTAIVKFNVDYKPVEPYYSTLCAVKKDDYCNKANYPKQGVINLKKYDKGWRTLNDADYTRD